MFCHLWLKTKYGFYRNFVLFECCVVNFSCCTDNTALLKFRHCREDVGLTKHSNAATRHVVVKISSVASCRVSPIYFYHFRAASQGKINALGFRRFGRVFSSSLIWHVLISTNFLTANALSAHGKKVNFTWLYPPSTVLALDKHQILPSSLRW